MEFSVRGMKHAISNETNKRVSEDAATELGNLLQHYGEEISELAIEHAENNGRETVREEDIIHGLKQRGRE